MHFINLVILITSLMLNTAVANTGEHTTPFQNLSVSQFSQKYPSKNKKIAKLLQPLRSLEKLSELDSKSDNHALNIISWQMEHGGFGLHEIEPYNNRWDGKQERSEWSSKEIELGNFDDGATVAEIRFLALAYKQSSNTLTKAQIKQSIKHAIEFILKAQYPNGGWPQVYPKRHNRLYSNLVTLNDNAMLRTMVLLSDIVANVAPFDTDVVDYNYDKQLLAALKSGVAHLLKAQIRTQGILTIWSAQHDPYTYEPKPARSYELASKSGRESVAVLYYLLNWPVQTTDVKQSIQAGVRWYKTNKVENLQLINGELTPTSNSELWYRFYEVDSDIPFFAGRDGIKRYKLSEVEEERRKGYSWAGDYASKLLKAVE